MITTGSVQAPETLYWGFAANLAKRGYVVLTYDVQGQGRSDTSGAAPDEDEGVPSQAGQPFYDGTEDALDFMLSTRSAPYDPRPSCGNANDGTGTDHSTSRIDGSRTASTRRSTPCTACSIAGGSASPVIRSAPPPSHTSARSTTASTRSSPGTTSRRRARAVRPAGVPVRLRAPPGQPGDH